MIVVDVRDRGEAAVRAHAMRLDGLAADAPMVIGREAMARALQALAPDECTRLTRIADRIRAFEEAGVDLLLLQFSPQYEEMERFAEEVLPFFRRSRDFQVQDGYPDMTVL